MLTEKENFLRVLRGEMPEWIPIYTHGPSPYATKPAANCAFMPEILGHPRGGEKDIWGVEYVSNPETGNATMPKTWDYLLDDITKWRDVIKAPDLSNVDWEAMAKKQLAGLPVDRNDTALTFNMHMGYFQNLMAFMGFEEGMCAMFEEPEEVMALFEYMCDFYCEVQEKFMHYIKPDIYGLTDDTAAWGSPFISPEMYHEMVMPFHKRQAKIARDNGIPITMHNCGKAACFIDDFLEMGVNMWEPCQACNDLVSLKEQYKGRMVFCGGWYLTSPEMADPNVSEEAIYASAKELIGRLAPGGGYVFSGGFLEAVGDTNAVRKNKAARRAAEDLCYNFYK